MLIRGINKIHATGRKTKQSNVQNQFHITEKCESRNIYIFYIVSLYIFLPRFIRITPLPLTSASEAEEETENVTLDDFKRGWLGYWFCTFERMHEVGRVGQNPISVFWLAGLFLDSMAWLAGLFWTVLAWNVRKKTVPCWARFIDYLCDDANVSAMCVKVKDWAQKREERVGKWEDGERTKRRWRWW